MLFCNFPPSKYTIDAIFLSLIGMVSYGMLALCTCPQKNSAFNALNVVDIILTNI